MCTIIIDPASVLGTSSSSGNIPLNLTVSGSATDCRNVVVIANGAGPLTSEVDADTGRWSVTFTHGTHFNDEIRCGEPLKVEAFCQNNQDCKDGFDVAALPCRPDKQPECPTVTVSAGTPGPCVDGTRTVTLSVDFGDGPAVAWAWDFGDGSGSGLQFPGQSQDIQHAYPADSENDLQYTATLQVGALGCTGDSATIPIPHCPAEPECPSVSVSAGTPGECVGGMRAIELTVSFSGEPQSSWSWDFGDGQSSGLFFPGDSLTIVHEYPADPLDSSAYTATVELGTIGCTGDSVSFEVPPCPTEPCPDEIEIVVARMVAGGRFQTVDPETAACLAPGTYRIRITAPDAEGYEYVFSVDGVHAQIGDSDSFETTLDEGNEITVSYTASIGDCPPASGAVTLAACTECPVRMALSIERIDPEGSTESVNPGETECLPPGRYRITVIEPTGAQYDYSWSLDRNGNGQAEVQSGELNRSFLYSLAESETITITATADAPGCVAISAAVTLEACICPDNLVMTVVDSNGVPVDADACVVPGTYTFAVSGEGVDADHTEWMRDGMAIGNGTVRTAGVTASSVSCAEVQAGTTMSATVSRADCNPITLSRTLDVCDRFVFRSCCELLSLLVLIVFGLLTIAVAIQSCPQVLVAPAAIAVAVTITPWVIGALSVMLLGLLSLWFFTCRPTRCGKLLPMIWQALLIAGIVFIYFGSCPACGGLMLLFGAFLLLIGAGLLIYWIMTCDPTRCQVIWELLRLGLASTIVGLVEAVITVIPLFLGAAMCISPFAFLFLWAINTFLDSLLPLLPVACGFNPIAGSTVATRVRRLMLPR